MPRRWKGVVLVVAGMAGCLAVFGLHPAPWAVWAFGAPCVVAIGVGKLWIGQYGYGDSDQ